MRVNDRENYSNIRESISMTNLKKIIDSKECSVIKLAMNSNVSSSTIHAYVNGQKIPSLPTLISMANFFNCNLDYLLDRTKNPFKVDEFEKWDDNMNNLIHNIMELSPHEQELVMAYVKGLRDNDDSLYSYKYK